MKTRLPRKALSLFLSLVMMLSLLPTMALAEGETTPVAKIGDTKYTSLADAVEAAQDGDVITITSNCNEGVTLSKQTIIVVGEDAEYNGEVSLAEGAERMRLFNADELDDVSKMYNAFFGFTPSYVVAKYPDADVQIINCDNGDVKFSSKVMDTAYSFNAFNVANGDMEIFNKLLGEPSFASLGGGVDFETISRNYESLTDTEKARVGEVLPWMLPYMTWIADFEVTFDKGVTAGSMGVGGYYGSYAKEESGGLGMDIELPNNMDSGDKYRMLYDYAGGKEIPYAGICLAVRTFNCGAYKLTDDIDGTKMTVSLHLYNGEGEEDIVIGTYDYTFPAPTCVAQIGDQGYETLQDAIAAVPTDGTETTITMIGDETMARNNGVTIATTQNVVLNLAGFTICNAASESKASATIINNGTLKIIDTSENKTGVITNAAEVDTAGNWNSEPRRNWATNTITNCGFLTLESGTIVNTAEGITYAVDINSTSRAASFVMNGGKLVNEHGDQAVRLFGNNTTQSAVFTMNGGAIQAGGFWMQMPNAKNDLANVTISSADAVVNGFVDLKSNGDAKVQLSNGTYDITTLRLRKTDLTLSAPYATISGGKYNIGNIDNQTANGEKSLVITGGVFTESAKTALGDTFLADGKTWVTNTDEDTKDTYPWTIGVAATYVAQIGDTKYTSLAAAVAAVNDGQTIEILCDIPDAVGMTINTGKTFTIDFKNHTYTVGKPGAGSTGTKTQGFQIIKGSNVTFKDGTIQVDPANKDVTWKKEATEKGIAWLINNYGNMTLTNMTINGENLAHNFVTDGGQEAAGTPRYVINNNTNSMTMTGGSITAAAGDVAVSANWYDSPSYPDHPAVTLTNATIAGKVEAIGGKINLKNGTTVDGMVRVGENGKDGDKKTPGTPGAVVTIENGAKVINNNYVAVFGANTLNVYGEVNGCVSTNGNAYNAGSVINIYDGAVVTNNEAGVESGDAIYMPNGTLNVYGGTITGTTAVYFKSTTLNITGGTFIGTGAKVNYQYYGNGGIATGDALVIDSCNYPSGISGVSVSGGSFKSEHANAVMSFVSKGAVEVKNFISGGLFSSEVSDTYVVVGKDVVSNPDAVTKEAYPYTIGFKGIVIREVEGGENVTTDVTTTTDYTVTVNAAVIADETVRTAVVNKTEVKGVELKKDASVGTGENRVTGVQAVINAAKEEATTDSNTEFTDAVAAATTQNTTVTVKVDVEVKPTEFNTESEIRFELKPVATVTIQNQGSDAAIQTVPVTNDMIDQDQDIEVSIYTGEMPAQILHKEGDKVIDSFTGDQIVFDEATGVSKVIIHHFSDLVAVMQNSAVVTYVAKNVQTDTQYTTLSAALAAAQGDETVILLADISNEPFVVVKDGVTLNLDGHNITGATMIYVTGDLVDTSVSKGVVSATTYYFDEDANSNYLAIYNGTGYSFYKLAVKSGEVPGEAEKFGFYFDKNSAEYNAAKTLIANNVSASRVKAIALVEWTDAEGKANQQYITFSDALMQTYISNADTKMLTITIIGAEALNASGDVTIQMGYKSVSELLGRSNTIY